MKYAGIGSRETPQDVLFVMYNIAFGLASYGVTLRSGGAKGADTAFEHGAMAMGGKREIYTAKMISDNSPLLAHAAKHHPNWYAMPENGYAQKLHARNSAIVCGPFLSDPVNFVVCWTPDGQITGGTGQAIRVANANLINVFNLFDDPTGAKFWDETACLWGMQ